MKNILFLFMLVTAPLEAYLSRALVADGWWAEADYLAVWRKKRFYPPLVTTGVLGAPGTEILFGGKNYDNSPGQGGYFDAGVAITRCFGFGGSLFLVGSEKICFEARNPPIANLSRPFFDPTDGQQKVIPIDGVLRDVQFEAKNNFWMIDGYVLWGLAACSYWNFAFTLGYGYATLRDNFEITDRIIPDTIGVDKIEGFDRFDCTNNYYAGVLGFTCEWIRKKLALHLWGKAYFGNMVRNIDISGERKSFLPSGAVIIEPGDLLSRFSNSGTHCKRSFEFVPLVGVDLQWWLCTCLGIQVGYFYTYFPRIFLAGEQIDLSVDTDHPISPNHSISFWLQGVRFGLFLNY